MVNTMIVNHAKFGIGQIVKHRSAPFRGAIFDVDPQFSSSDELWLAIPEEHRPRRDQPFYHLLAEADDGPYVAYVSEQNLMPDTSGEPVRHPEAEVVFAGFDRDHYRPRRRGLN